MQKHHYSQGIRLQTETGFAVLSPGILQYPVGVHSVSGDG